MKYIYAILFFLLNYLFDFFLAFIIMDMLVLKINCIDSDTMFLVTQFISMVFVLFEWFLFSKYYKQFRLKRADSRDINIWKLFVIVILPTVLFLSYEHFVNQSQIPQSLDVKKFFLYELIYFTLIPITEELIYREILYKILIKKNVFISSIIISILFSLTHIGVGKIEVVYLFYIFVNGMVLFFVRFRKNLLYSIISHSLINVIVFTYQYIIV